MGIKVSGDPNAGSVKFSGSGGSMKVTSGGGGDVCTVTFHSIVPGWGSDVVASFPSSWGSQNPVLVNSWGPGAWAFLDPSITPSSTDPNTPLVAGSTVRVQGWGSTPEALTYGYHYVIGIVDSTLGLYFATLVTESPDVDATWILPGSESPNPMVGVGLIVGTDAGIIGNLESAIAGYFMLNQDGLDLVASS